MTYQPYFILPESFDPSEFLYSTELRRRGDDARYLISLILTKVARRDVDRTGLVRLQAKHLANVMYQATYAKVVKALLQGGAIERFPYCVGGKSFGFRLSARFISDRHVRVQATDSRLIGRLANFHEQQDVERLVRMRPVHLALATQQQRLRIWAREARRILERLPSSSNPFDVQGILIASIENQEFHINVGRYGRVANSISCLKRELRKALHVEGLPLGSVDLSCAQPALLGKLIREDTDNANGQGTGTGAKQSKYDSSRGLPLRKESHDFGRYLALVQTGQLYEYLVEQLCEHGIKRKELKRKFLTDVVAKKGRYPSIVEDTFRAAFPSVYRFIRRVNATEHSNLIRQLQCAESRFVIETVVADLVTRHPSMFLITLHDAIFTTVRNLPMVVQAFNRGFEKVDFEMQIKIDV